MIPGLACDICGVTCSEQALQHAAAAGKNALAAMKLLIDFDANLDVQNKKGEMCYTCHMVPSCLVQLSASAHPIKLFCVVVSQVTRPCTSEHSPSSLSPFACSFSLAQVLPLSFNSLSSFDLLPTFHPSPPAFNSLSPPRSASVHFVVTVTYAYILTNTCELAVRTCKI